MVTTCDSTTDLFGKIRRHTPDIRLGDIFPILELRERAHAGHDEREGKLAGVLVGDANHADVADIGMVKQVALELRGSDCATRRMQRSVAIVVKKQRRQDPPWNARTLMSSCMDIICVRSAYST